MDTFMGKFIGRYTYIVPFGARFLVLVAALTAVVWAQEPKPAEPPEEDETLTAKEYSFNPLQAKKEVQIGDYYFKKGSFRAAAGRYREATKWDENLAEAYLRLGEACEKLKDFPAMRKALEKFLSLAPDGKDAPRVRKLLSAKR
jgi:tetratricopeptide (TPR) repeat protein